MNAATYRPAHGGYPPSPRRRPRVTIFRNEVATVTAPPGFPRTAVEEAFALGRAAGGGGRRR